MITDIFNIFRWDSLKYILTQRKMSKNKKLSKLDTFNIGLDHENAFFIDKSEKINNPIVFFKMGNTARGIKVQDNFFVVAEKVPEKAFIHNTDKLRTWEIDPQEAVATDFVVGYGEELKTFRILYDVMFLEPIDTKEDKPRDCPNLFIKYHEYPAVMDALREYFNMWHDGSRNPMFKYLPIWAQEHIQNKELF